MAVTSHKESRPFTNSKIDHYKANYAAKSNFPQDYDYSSVGLREIVNNHCCSTYYCLLQSNKSDNFLGQQVLELSLSQFGFIRFLLCLPAAMRVKTKSL